MTNGSNIMEWSQFIIFCIGVFGCFFWNRSESRSDIRNMETKLSENRKETNDLIISIQKEIKDFHKCIYNLEKKYRKRR